MTYDFIRGEWSINLTPRDRGWQNNKQRKLSVTKSQELANSLKEDKGMVVGRSGKQPTRQNQKMKISSIKGKEESFLSKQTKVD